MSRFFLLVAACILLVLYGSCDESFNPSAAFQPRMVVYSVLTTESDTQYVRVYTTYNPPDNDPSKNPAENPVTDAVITISSGATTYKFQKVSLKQPDTSRYATDNVVYVSYPFRPGRGRTYRLTVSSRTYGTATAVTTVPDIARVVPVKDLWLSFPSTPVQRGDSYAIQTYLSLQAKAFLARVYVDDLAPDDQGGWQLKRRQVPIYTEHPTPGTFRFVYPDIKRRVTISDEYPDVQMFVPGAWRDFLINVIAPEDGPHAQFVQALFQVVQFDSSYYDAYSVANYVKDRNSIRLDERDYTNMYGGVGVFGSLAVDSLVRPLPAHISY